MNLIKQSNLYNRQPKIQGHCETRVMEISIIFHVTGRAHVAQPLAYKMREQEAAGSILVSTYIIFRGWLVVLGFNATVIMSWRSVTHMCFLAVSHQYQHNLSFQSHRLLFSHASAEVRGEITPERNFASTGDRPHNHQVTSPTRSSLGLIFRGLMIVIATRFNLL